MCLHICLQFESRHRLAWRKHDFNFSTKFLNVIFKNVIWGTMASFHSFKQRNQILDLKCQTDTITLAWNTLQRHRCRLIQLINMLSKTKTVFHLVSVEQFTDRLLGDDFKSAQTSTEWALTLPLDDWSLGSVERRPLAAIKILQRWQKPTQRWF